MGHLLTKGRYLRPKLLGLLNLVLKQLINKENPFTLHVSQVLKTTMHLNQHPVLLSVKHWFS